MNDIQYTVEPIMELRMNALLMSLANTHLCEDVFLTKIGQSIEQSIAVLKKDISAMKKEFPGKFANEVDTDTILGKISDTAKTMLEPVDELRENCVLGDLGKDMEADVKSVVSAVNQVKEQVYGHDVTYSKTDSASRLFSGIKDFGSSLGGASLLGLKILCVVIVLAIPVLSYLYFTMETEEDILARISVNETRIAAQQDIFNQLDREKTKISKAIVSLEMGKIDREEKIAILNLEMDIHRVDEEQQKAEVEIEGFEDENATGRQQLEEIKSTSLIKRLLRLKP